MSEDINNENTRSDELSKILEEYRDKNAGTEEKGSAHLSDYSADLTEGTDDALMILASGRETPEAEEPAAGDDTGAQTVGEEEAHVPDSIFSHLTDEGAASSGDSAGMSTHFTESEDLPASEEPAEDGDGDEEAEEEEEREGGLSRVGRVFQRMSLVPKVLIYIAAVVIVSAYLAYFIISVGNDVFAFVSEDGEVEIEIAEGATDDEVAKILEDSGVIDYAWAYRLYMRYRGSGDSSSEYIPGRHTLNKNMNYSQIITSLTATAVDREVLRITIPEGFTVDQIIDLFVSKGLGTREKYVEAINEYPYKHEFVKLLTEKGYSEDRKYRLEGYLFPDTYDFYNTTSEVYVINTLLNNFHEKFWKDYIRKDGNGESYRDMMINEYKMDFDEIVTLASMVQAEGKTAEDFEYISYVFHNRLNHKDTFPTLESDATIQYVLEEREQDSSKIDISYDSPYNTYIYKGLPPGAISNPGLDAFMAAMFPEAPTNANGVRIDAYFFVSNNAGKTYYAAGRNGHANNVAQVAKDNAAIESGTYEG